VGDFFNTLLSPLTIGVAWVMLGWHKLWTTIGIGGGWAWALSIVGLTIVAADAADPAGDAEDPGEIHGQDRP
jgi:hypothetical protein